MNLVMLEPLGVSEVALNELAQPLLEAGHSFMPCTQPLSEEEKKKRIKDADVAIIANSPLTEEVLEAAEHLSLLAVAFTGYDHVPLDKCRQKGITVTNAQGYATESTAELALLLMLAALRDFNQAQKASRSGQTKAGQSHRTLQGKTVGVVGTGAIGTRVIELLKPFGVRVLCWSRSHRPEVEQLGAAYANLDTVLAESDLVTLHVPATPETKGLLNQERLSKMKSGAILVNCARGAVVDSQALAAAMESGKIRAVGIDVLETEPPFPTDHPLLQGSRSFVTPHVGFFTEESMIQRAQIVFDTVKAFLEGHPINVVRG